MINKEMRVNTKHIAIDLGATSGRVVVGNLDKIEVVHRFDSSNEIILGTLYWDIIKIFSEIKIGIKKAFALYGDEIVSIAIDSWGVDYALLDENGVLVSPLFHYRDKRGKEVFDEVNTLIGKDRLFNTTGLAFQEYNTIYQIYSQLKSNKKTFDVASNYLSVPDLIAYFLTGKIVNERTHASTTGLYNCNTKDWDWDIIKDLGLPKKIFSPIVNSGTIIGSLETNLRLEFGIKESVKVIACATHDTAAAVSFLKNSAYISSGTWSLIGINLDKPLLSDEALKNGFTNETGGDNQITLVKNIMGLWISNQCIESHFGKGKKLNWKEIDFQTNESLSYEGYIDPLSPVFVSPNSPENTMKERVYNCLVKKGFEPPLSIGEYLVAIYRGLAKTYHKALLEIERLSNVKIDSLQIIGGGCQNDILNKLTAEEIAKNVKIGPVEATALGNIIYQIKGLSDSPISETDLNNIYMKLLVKEFNAK
jgi:rhamnulokinase